MCCYIEGKKCLENIINGSNSTEEGDENFSVLEKTCTTVREIGRRLPVVWITFCRSNSRENGVAIFHKYPRYVISAYQ